MRRLVLALLASAAMATAATADTVLLDDPLHGYCADCAAGNNNTPIFEQPGQTIEQFGFTASPNLLTGTLQLDILIPNNDAIGTLNLTGTGLPTLGASPSLYTNGFGVAGTSVWAATTSNNNPTLADFLQNGAKPDQNLMNYLGATQALDPGATGFDVLTLPVSGTFTLPTPGSVPPDLFNMTTTLPDGAFIVAFLTEADGTVVGTANSSALFVTPVATTPLPGTVFLLGSVLLGGWWLLPRRKREPVVPTDAGVIA